MTSSHDDDMAPQSPAAAATPSTPTSPTLPLHDASIPPAVSPPPPAQPPGFFSRTAGKITLGAIGAVAVLAIAGGGFALGRVTDGHGGHSFSASESRSDGGRIAGGREGAERSGAHGQKDAENGTEDGTGSDQNETDEATPSPSS